MGVYVEQEWRYKKKGSSAQIRSLRSSKSTFAYKINEKRNQKRKTYTKKERKSSNEVIIKFTEGAKSRAGIRNAIKYISRDYTQKLVDSDNLKFENKQDIDATIRLMQMNANLPKKDGIEITKSLMFSPPRVAGISKENALESVRKTLTSLYPDNYFVMGYHKDTDNEHIHVVMNMDTSEGKRLQIKGKDFKEMRIKFAENLIEYGYDVKATIKPKDPKLELKELEDEKNRNIYEVVDFGMGLYAEYSKKKSVFLAYKTHAGKEVKVWGAELEGELSKNKVNIGDKIKLSKIGEVKISVPIIDKDGKMFGWKETNRNQWEIENLSNPIEKKIELGSEVTEESPSKNQEIQLNSRERIKTHIAAKQEFDHEKNMTLDSEYKQKYEEEQKLRGCQRLCVSC